MAGALDGETAMPLTFAVIRSCTTLTCSSPPPCSPGPMYRHSIFPALSFSAFMQPSRAWSKNGLFMFFGTSANVYSLALAGAPPNPSARTATAVGPTSSFVIICRDPVESVKEGGPNRSARAVPADPLEQDREDDEDADEGALPVGVDAGHQQTVADHLDQRGTHQRAEGPALAADQVGAADHGAGDHPQLVALAQGVDGRALPADDHHRRDRRGQAGDDVGAELDPVDRHAGQPGRVLVAADRVQVAAPGGEVEDEGEHHGHQQQQPDRVRDPDDVAAADGVEGV